MRHYFANIGNLKTYTYTIQFYGFPITNRALTIQFTLNSPFEIGIFLNILNPAMTASTTYTIYLYLPITHCAHFECVISLIARSFVTFTHTVPPIPIHIYSF